MAIQSQSDSREQFTRGLICAAMGALIMGCCGAAIFGIVTSYSTGADIFGPSRNWAPIMAILGAIFGAVAGGLFGFYLGLTATGRINSGLIGLLYGLILAVIWLVLTSGNHYEWQ